MMGSVKKALDYLKSWFGESFFFFLFFFFTLMVVNLFHFFFSAKPSLYNSLFFLLAHLGQSLATVCFLALACDFIKGRSPKWVHLLVIVLIFLYLFALSVEALFVLLMDISFCEGLSIAFGADLQNFIELLYLSDLGIGAWIGLFMVSIGAPFLALGFYYVCKVLEKKHPLPLKRAVFFNLGFCSILFLLSLDLLMSWRFSSEEIENHKKMLPWKHLLLKIRERQADLKHGLSYQPPLKRKDLPFGRVKAQELPNIYLIIAESLREDYLSSAIAPTLFSFKQECTQAQISRSCANCTHLSWFSLFHSKLPSYWSYNKTGTFQEGGLPLVLLKEMGYAIHVYSAAQLRFYHFDEVLFGENHYLASTYKIFSHYGKFSAAQADKAAVEALTHDIYLNKNYGNIYILFLDSTHFNYSWPEDFSPPFTPCHELGWTHRLSTQPHQIQMVKNRYKNSINYVDTLFKQIVDTLKHRQIYEDSFIVFCGDHGEEFKEEGKLFHASNLNTYQTNIPLYMKLGPSQTQVAAISHIDVFPSILDAICDDTRLLQSFDGSSIFTPNRSRFSVSARYNASFAPYRFLLTSPEVKGQFSFSNRLNLFQSNKVKFLSEMPQDQEQQLLEHIDEIFCQQ
jgi:glucan phosphoethanolaminetransferase (alkaline phosphatase superfamily)